MRKAVKITCLALFLWISSAFTAAAAPENDRERPVIRVAYCENMPPFQYTDVNNMAAGMHIDMLNRMAEKQGIEVEYLPFSAREECIASLDSREADAVVGYPVNNYDSRKYQTTGELSKATICIIVKKEAQAADGKETGQLPLSKAVFELGSIDYAYMRSMGIKEFIAANSQMGVAQAFMNGTAGIAVGTSESLEYILDQEGFRNQYRVLHDQITSISYSILLNSDNQRLRATLDTELAELRTSGEYEKIYKRWITSRDLSRAKVMMYRILAVGGVVVLAAFMIIGIISRLNRLLRDKVAEKTEELRHANEMLEQQVIRLRNESSLRNRIIEAVPTGILFLDRNFCVTMMNPAARKMCGTFGEREAIGDIRKLPLFGSLMEELDKKMTLPRLREQPYLLAVEERARQQKYRCWFHFLKDGGMLLMAENVTSEEQHRKEQFEREKAQVLGRLVAGIAHELKNPLMNLKTAVSLILTQGDRQEVKEAFARFIPEEVDRMNRLVEGLLNYSRPTREKSEVVQLAETVNNCLYLTNITAKGRGIKFSVELDDTLYICVQKDMLRQSLINILINSVWSIEKKQADSGVPEDGLPSITVKVYREDFWVCLSVHDRGVGMNEEELRRCTDPFYTTKKAGTGLGLALTKQFVEENGGTLSISSRAGIYTEILIRFRRYETNEEQHSDY